MPIDYSKYPSNWKTEIRPAILERAKHRCEKCGVPNYAVGYRSKEGHFYEWGYIQSELDNVGYDLFDDVLSNNVKGNGEYKKATRIVLTISHLDHNIENNDYSNLAAYCQRCHLVLDSKQHRENARKTIQKKKGLQSLF